MRDHKTIVDRTPPPPPPSSQTSMLQRSYGVFRNVRKVATGSLALVGLAAVAAAAYEYKEYKDVIALDGKADDDVKGGDEKKAKKKVLVLPFHRMRVIEKKKRGFASFGYDEGDDQMLEVEIRELVDVIHQAADDPNIVALYGIFGHGFNFRVGGWGHVEEIRNALKVWRESHRTHSEPNLEHEKLLARRGNSRPKPSFAFADSFADPDDQGNKEYLLACGFSHVHMQKNGELNLFGVASPSLFFRTFMETYGIKAHVFKHGKYKNAPNMFTEKGYTREHRQNVQNLVDRIDRNKRDGIENDRNAKGFDLMVWKMIRKHGTFTGQQALKLGLVDYLPKLDPLQVLLELNKDNDADSKAKLKSEWAKDTELDKFQATEKISFSEYRSQLAKRKKMEKRKWQIHDRMKKLAENNPALRGVLNAMGYEAPHFNIDKNEYDDGKVGEKIALVHVNGSINDELARKTVNSLRKIRKDPNVKAVVLRVDSPGGGVTASESILQECKDLPQPVICSMGNVCASGGYYIATGCEKIFALPTTITGSIGVFSVKFDLTGLAKRYGISVQHVTTGPYSASYHPFMPLNSLVKRNLGKQVDRHYSYFKSIVSESRGLDMRVVESLAQGRVWTGGEAMNSGLVDELGGLERAIAHARRAYTNGEAEVECWPRPESLLSRLKKASEMADGSGSGSLAAMIQVLRGEFGFEEARTEAVDESNALQVLAQAIIKNPQMVEGLNLGGVSMTMDENVAFSHLALENASKLSNESSPLLHPSFWSER